MTDAAQHVGRLVVISGPSGAGKTSVCRALKELSDVQFSISATTRPIRSGEVDGVDYHFLTRGEFEAKVEQGEFLEWASYNDQLYGTPKWPIADAIAAGRVFLLEIEVDGTRQLREADTDGLYIFIAPPSIAELRHRLELRGANSAEDIASRVRIAEAEVEAAKGQVAGLPLYDHTVVNDDLQATIAQVRELIGR
jgi:guanylate kinase